MLPPISLWTSLSLLFIHVLHLTCLFCTNTSYLGYYRSPSFKDLNTSTLPCIHHILPESARYTMWKHTDDSFFLCFYKLKKKKKTVRDIWYKTITLLSMVLFPCLSWFQSTLYQLTHHYFSSQWIFLLTCRKLLQLFSFGKLLCLFSPPSEWWSFYHSRSILKISSYRTLSATPLPLTSHTLRSMFW